MAMKQSTKRAGIAIPERQWYFSDLSKRMIDNTRRRRRKIMKISKSTKREKQCHNLTTLMVKQLGL
jgi:hypothetical protein